MSLKSLDNAPKVLLNIPHKDKIIHFMFYFVFVVLWSRNSNPEKKTVFKIGVIAIIYGIIIEVLQGLITTTRTPDCWDVLANTLGTIVAVVILLKYKINR